MSFVIGYLFSEESIQELRAKGFDFIEEPASEGYRVFAVVLNNATSFQFHVISDENLYRQSHPIEHFLPFQSSVQPPVSDRKQSNTVYHVQEILTKENIESGPLHNYLRIRKPGSIWAIHLNCENFEIFCKQAKPERIYNWKGKPAALIHLGPASFDLLVTQEKPNQRQAER